MRAGNVPCVWCRSLSTSTKLPTQAARRISRPTAQLRDDFATAPPTELASPRALASALDQYVIGQTKAKRILSVAVFNHYTKIRANLSESEELQWYNNAREQDAGLNFNADDAKDADTRAILLGDFVGQVEGTYRAPPGPPPLPDLQLFDKSNVLVLGPSGSGKTLLARTLARCIDVPFCSVDATPMTQSGYVGEDAENCIQRLLQVAEWDVKKASVGIVFIDEIDKIAKRAGSDAPTRDVSGEGVQQALLRIIEGTTVTVKGDTSPQASGSTPNTRKSTNLGLPGGPLPSSAPVKGEVQIDTSNILFILSGAFVGLEKVIERRISRGSIGFGAKLKTSKHAEEKGANATNYFTPASLSYLDQVEPGDLITYGLIPEFVGRLPVLAALKALTEDDLLRVLTEPKNALVTQYESLFSLSGIDCKFTTPALREVAKQALAKQTGARGLRRIMESLLLDPFFEAPQSNIKYVLINRDAAKVGGKAPLYFTANQKALFHEAIAEDERRDVEQQSVKPV